MIKRTFLLIILTITILSVNSFAQIPWWKHGIIVDEFIYKEAPYPSCHASTIAETPAGMVAAWFGGTRERNPDVGIWVSRLIDGKWTPSVEVVNGVQNDTLRYPTWNPVLFQIPDGELLMFYKVGPSPSSWWGMLMRSSDNGLTWSEPEALPEGYVGPVKNKPVLLKDGTLICPTSTEGDEGWRVHMEMTKDFGKTWTKTGPINDGKSQSFNGYVLRAIQPSILTYPDGRLQILCRTRNRAIGESWSEDGGHTWSQMQMANLPNNNSGTDAVTLADGRQLLVYNHVLPEGTKFKGLRTPLNVAISEDGINWSAALILEDSPISQYSYPAVIQASDGMVHFVYTWRRETIKHVVVDPSKLTLKKIENGVWPL